MEFKVYSPFPAPYAGTLDYFGYMDGKVSLIDWKTGALSEPDSWIKLQLAGYERAKPRNLKQTEKFYVVKFDKDGNYRIYEIQIGAIELEDFDSLVRAHHVRQRYL
jgi:ATP-dependent exoDNAse (exonuclease V) beta subunit